MTPLPLPLAPGLNMVKTGDENLFSNNEGWSSKNL